MAGPGWEPILSGTLQSQAAAFVGTVLGQEADRNSENCSCVELCERALFLSYFAAETSSNGFHVGAVRLLNLVSDRLSKKMASGLFYGLAAVGWTVEHVTKNLLIGGVGQFEGPQPNDDPLSALEETITRRLEPAPWTGSFDLLEGLAGLGIFYLERLPRLTAFEGLQRVLNHLDLTKEESSSGITWRTTPAMMTELRHRQEHPTGYYNLGVAHGLAGVIGFLNRLVYTGIEKKRAEYLLRRSIQWLIANKTPTGTAQYSTWLIPGKAPMPSRISWCYGDLGICRDITTSRATLRR